jgi:3-methyladenine DNA glycosylase AlkD
MEIVKNLEKLANPEKAKVLAGFFKTGKGEYGEGDVFLGIRVGDIRKEAKRNKTMELNEVKELLKSKIHEHRLAALLILVEKYQKSDEKGKKRIYDFYWKNSKKVNNWDLVDLSADKIVGDYLFDKDKKLLYKLARSKNLWERRIAIIATFHFIKNGKFDDTLRISEILLNDKHDLIHKAVGWMLREVGKRDQKVEEKFLKKHYKKMPRTMLRYAIERFDEKKRKFYMS